MVQKVKVFTLQEVECASMGAANNVKHVNTQNKVKKSDTLFLYFTVITGILLYLVGGTTQVWQSPAIVQLQSNDTDVNPLGRPITTVEISMLVGLPLTVSMVGAIFLPKLADIIGRKKSLQLMGLAMSLSIIGIAFSTRIDLIITFSCLLISAFAGVWGTLPIYITEICEDHNRAKYGCLMSVFIPIGHLYTYIIGPTFSFRTFTLLTAAPAIPFLVFFFFAPESPVYSLRKGKAEECTQALKKLRNNKSPEELEVDFNKITDTLEAIEEKGINIMKLFSTKEGRIGLVLAMLPVLVQYLSGVPIIQTLLAPIFNESGSDLSGNTIAIISGAVQLVSFAFTVLIVEKIGRNPLLIASSVCAGISVTVLGIFFYLKHINSPLVHEFQWVPLAFVLLYIIAYSLGLGPVPMSVVSELFPINLRTSANGFTLTVTTFLLTVYISAYPLMAELIGTHWCMWIFASSCFIGAFLIYLIMPETKGKSVMEIQEVLKSFKIRKLF